VTPRSRPTSGEFLAVITIVIIGQHNHGLRAALAFIHCKPDRLRPVREQAAAKAFGVLDHPVAGPILPDEQAGSFDLLLDH
jgi:hypothetical protein